MRTRVKFCGCTSISDAMLAVEAGADAIGLILAPSPRRLALRDAASIARTLPPFVTPVGVFVDPSREEVAAARASIPNLAVQLHGDETPEFVGSLGGAILKTIHVDPKGANAQTIARDAERYPRVPLLFDARSGGKRGGVALPWALLESLARRRRTIVAGGLTPENVALCVRTLRPFAVDVRSGVESGDEKDAQKMRAFVAAVRAADAA